MSYKILTAIDPENKTGTMIMPLIEEKIGFGFAGVYPDKFCARCINVAPVARNVSRQGRNEPQRSQLLFVTAPALVSRIIRGHYNFSRDQEF
jgi:hypothetical protein